MLITIVTPLLTNKIISKKFIIQLKLFLKKYLINYNHLFIDNASKDNSHVI